MRASPRAARGVCTFEFCERMDDGPHGLCKMHDTRRRRHGDPAVAIAPDERRVLVGERHPRWTGSDATYTAVHQRLRRDRGPASSHLCACGAPARQWSYDRTDPDERTSDVGPYSVNPAHYLPRCVSCHKRFDLAARS